MNDIVYYNPANSAMPGATGMAVPSYQQSSAPVSPPSSMPSSQMQMLTLAPGIMVAVHIRYNPSTGRNDIVNAHTGDVIGFVQFNTSPMVPQPMRPTPPPQKVAQDEEDEVKDDLEVPPLVSTSPQARPQKDPIAPPQNIKFNESVRLAARKMAIAKAAAEAKAQEEQENQCRHPFCKNQRMDGENECKFCFHNARQNHPECKNPECTAPTTSRKHTTCYNCYYYDVPQAERPKPCAKGVCETEDCTNSVGGSFTRCRKCNVANTIYIEGRCGGTYKGKPCSGTFSIPEDSHKRLLAKKKLLLCRDCLDMN